MTDQQSSPLPYAGQPQSTPPRRGGLPYGLGFLAYIPIPFVNFVVAGIVMAAVYPGQKKYGPVAAENARRAANWGLTLIAVIVVCVGLTLVLIPFVGSTEYSPVASVPLMVIVPLGITHLVVIIMGLVKANRGDVLVNRLAIPFIRAGR